VALPGVAGSPKEGRASEPLPTLKRAKEWLTVEWLLRRLNALYDSVRAGGRGEAWETFYVLCHQTAKFDDENAPAVLRYWLEEHGYGQQLQDWIVRPGLAAKVVWPKGWDTVAAT